MHDESPRLFVITGIMAAGKSTVAQALADRLPRSVHLRGDVFRRMIVGGRVEMASEPPNEAREQLSLRYRIAAQAARAYLEAGFSVVHQDVILGEALRQVLACYERPVHLVVLCPSVEAVERRERSREKTGYGGFTVRQLDDALRKDTPRIGLWLDNSLLGADATVDRILAALPEALTR